jgi:hypothetical protein
LFSSLLTYTFVVPSQDGVTTVGPALGRRKADRYARQHTFNHVDTPSYFCPVLKRWVPTNWVRRKAMSGTHYSETIVDCPSLGLRDVSLSTVERILQDEWQTLESFAFVLGYNSNGRLTVTDSVPITAAGK